MSSTRYSQQPLQIYQDPITSFDHAPMPSSQNSTTMQKKSPLRPIKNAASRRNIVFNPPQAGSSKQSPLKSAYSSSPNRAPFSSKLNMVSMPPPGGPRYNTDSMEKRQPLLSKFKPQKALFTTFSSTQKSTDKENYPQNFYQAPPNQYLDGFDQNNYSLEGLYGQKPPLKRTLMEAAPIHETGPFKKMKTNEEVEEVSDPQELPAPESFPPLQDDGSKPPHSYAQLIGMSILRAQNRRLTLAQIYKWISDTYSFYSATDAGWQNSIRHNLSLNKAFIKQERPKDDPGKGNYWAIEPGMEHQFIKEKLTRRPGSNEQAPTLPATFAQVNQSEPCRTALLPPMPLPPMPAPPQELPCQQIYSMPESSQVKEVDEPSSDATIPASDISNLDPILEEPEELPPSSPLIQSSPPTSTMHSSPPVPRHVPRRQHTPPPVPRFPSSSRSRSHKRKFASMDDSGYFSSLDSSAMRRNPNRLLTSEADRPRIKRGRAEEEIARLRGSSYDSPTKSRTIFAQPSSSPLRQVFKKPSSQMLPPLTPAVKLKAPARPPLSVSPNTNLRLHRDRVREMVGSPLRGVTCLEENIPWSPAFNLDESPFIYNDYNADFDVFGDIVGSNALGVGSPEKRSVKRPRLDRSRSANILADISNSSTHTTFKSITSTPLLKLTPSFPGAAPFSPTRSLADFFDSPNIGSGSPSKMASPSFNLGDFDLHDQEFFGAEFLEEIAGFEGVDIMQGFQKIGSGVNVVQSARSTPKTGSNSTRPSLGRSFSTRF